VGQDVIIRAEGLTKVYRIGGYNLDVLKGVDVVVGRGEFLSIAGPSGAGKSTLLHLLGMLDTPTAGRVLHGGKDVAAMPPAWRAAWRNQRVGFVFQFYHLLPDFTALENVAMPALVRTGMLGGVAARRKARQRAGRVLEVVNLGERARHRPSELSGGERQRVAIARALMNEPELLLCDEPTGNLDTDTGKSIIRVLRQVRRETGCTLVMVTHDEKIAARGDRTIHLVDGRIVDS
jgi:lipoprotein-releasing system ATP-binding protein